MGVDPVLGIFLMYVITIGTFIFIGTKPRGWSARIFRKFFSKSTIKRISVGNDNKDVLYWKDFIPLMIYVGLALIFIFI